jgi:hypothetical protein
MNLVEIFCKTDGYCTTVRSTSRGPPVYCVLQFGVIGQARAIFLLNFFVTTPQSTTPSFCTERKAF